MKVIYYKRKRLLDVHSVGPGEEISHRFYIPKEDIAIFSYESNDICIVKKGKELNEARMIARGKDPTAYNVTFSDKKEFDVDTEKLNNLIEKLNEHSELLDQLQNLEFNVQDKYEELLGKEEVE
jgi:hypothetical protein